MAGHPAKKVADDMEILLGGTSDKKFLKTSMIYT